MTKRDGLQPCIHDPCDYKYTPGTQNHALLEQVERDKRMQLIKI